VLSCIEEGLEPPVLPHGRVTELLPVDEPALTTAGQRVCTCCDIYRPNSAYESPHHPASAAHLEGRLNDQWVITTLQAKTYDLRLLVIKYCPSCGGTMPKVDNVDYVPVLTQGA
jgi:hypothetical protein